MTITKYRIKKAYECYVNGRKNKRSVYWSIKLAMWWFHSGFKWEYKTK